MKKVLLTMVALATGATLVHAQGLFKFNGGFSGGSVLTNTSSFYSEGTGTFTTGTMLGSSSGQVYDFALLVASTTTAGDATPSGSDWSLALTTTSANVIATNGLVAGQVAGPGAGNGFAQNGLAAGASEEVMILAWSANLGTLSQVLNQYDGGVAGGAWTASGYFNFSAIEDLTSGGAGTPASPATSITGSVPTFQLFAVSPSIVPEPTTLALAGLGGLSMLFLRRRNKS